MKALDYILFCSAVAFLVIGIYEFMVLGIAAAYGIFMLSIVLLFIFWYRKSQRSNQ
ncbi:MAG: hypothetical protein ACJA2C_001632 [Marinoscillum sp.]|jgi:hypothetical protein